ncbi:MAG: ComEC/Rec2 family competence protein [Victivallales bacterium]|nr:ComEC/Rec2 family competence protein [Victivallales bacterium]
MQVYFRCCPALFCLGLYAAGVAGEALEFSPRLSWGLVVAGMALAALTKGNRFWRWCWLPLAGRGAALLALGAPGQSYLRNLPREECSCRIVAVVDMPRRNLGKMPRFQLEIRRMERGGRWEECRGRVLGVFPEGSSPQEGSVVLASGALVCPNGPGGYRRHLQCQGIHRECRVWKWRALAPPGDSPGNWRRGFRRMRRSLTDRLTEGIESPLSAAMYRAMALGQNDELAGADREVFIRSASVHVFSISGMHVSTMARCLAWLMVALLVPRRWQRLVAVPPLALYVMLAGGAPSALRAFWMAAFLALAASRLRCGSPQNALGASGLLLLVWNPLYLTHVGFVYSFTLVFFLLRGAEWCTHLYEIILERRLWMPRSAMTLRLWRMPRLALAIVSGSLLAWLASAGLMMRYNNMLSFGALAVNLVVPPLADLLILAAPFKLLCSFAAPSLSWQMGHWLDWLLRFLHGVACCGASSGLYRLVACPPLWQLWGYYLLLGAALSALRPAILRWCALLGVVAWLGWEARSVPSNAEVTVAVGNGTPSVIWWREGSAVVCQPGSRECARQVAAELTVRGASTVVVAVPSSRDVVGARLLAERAAAVYLSRAVEGTRGIHAWRERLRSQGVYVKAGQEGRYRELRMRFLDSQTWQLEWGGHRLRCRNLPATGETLLFLHGQKVVLRPCLKPKVRRAFNPG